MATEKEIKLFKMDIHEEDIDFLEGLKRLDSCHHLELLNLRYCRIRCDNIWKILRDRKVSEIVELKLNHTDLHDKICGLVEYVVLKKVQRLSLVNTHMKNRDLMTFEDELSEQDRTQVRLHSLNFMHNALETGGFEIIAEICNALPPVILLLDVTNCELDDDAVGSFLETISDGKVIKSLIMSQNDRITSGGMVSIGGVAEKCKTETLDLSVCSMQEADLDGIAEASPKTLRYLRLCKNMELSPSKIIALYRDWNWLESVDVKECWFDRKDLKLIVDALKGCQVISEEKNTDNEGIMLVKEKRRKTTVATRGPTTIATNTEISRSRQFPSKPKRSMYFSPRVIIPEIVQGQTDDAIVSKRVLIYREGGKIELWGCAVSFPPGCFDNVTEVRARVEMNSSIQPRKFICISATLWVKSQRKLLSMASVSMESWCMMKNKNLEQIQIYVLHQKNGSSEWDVVSTFYLSEKKIIHFDCANFSPYVLAVHEDELSATDLIVEGRVYADKKNNFSLAFFLQHDLIQKSFEDLMEKRHCQLQLNFSPLPVKINDKISAELNCTSDNFRFPEKFHIHFEIDSDFVILKKKVFFHSPLIGGTEEPQYVVFKSALKKNEMLVDGPHSFNYEILTIKTESKSQDVAMAPEASQGATGCNLVGSINMYNRREFPPTSRALSAPDVPSSAPGNLHAAEIEARASILLKKFKFEAVVSLLQDLPPSEEQQMMLAECYLWAEDWSKASNAMNTLKTLLASSTPRSSPGSIKSMIDSYISNSSHIKALICLPCVSYFYKLDKNPINAVWGLRNCSISCYLIIEALFQQGGRMQRIAVEIGCEIILQILTDLRSVTGADESVKALNEAECLYGVGFSCVTVGKLTEAIGFYEQGVEIMKRQFGWNDPKKLLGKLLNDLAFVYSSLGDFHKAVDLYLNALKAHELAQDYANEEEKREKIDSSKRGLQYTRQKMAK